jgi:hypothetical protein
LHPHDFAAPDHALHRRVGQGTTAQATSKTAKIAGRRPPNRNSAKCTGSELAKRATNSRTNLRRNPKRRACSRTSNGAYDWENSLCGAETKAPEATEEAEHAITKSLSLERMRILAVHDTTTPPTGAHATAKCVSLQMAKANEPTTTSHARRNACSSAHERNNATSSKRYDTLARESTDSAPINANPMSVMECDLVTAEKAGVANRVDSSSNDLCGH